SEAPPSAPPRCPRRTIPAWAPRRPDAPEACARCACPPTPGYLPRRSPAPLAAPGRRGCRWAFRQSRAAPEYHRPMAVFFQEGHRAPLDYHRRLVGDFRRMDAFERAIRRLVRPGDVVLDLGTGTGILAMLCARAGAARVHAVESMPISAPARRLRARNGLADRVVIHEADITRMDPVEPVDLVVSDFLGCFLVDDGMMAAAVAAGRWLADGGHFCPAEVRLRCAPVAVLRFDPVDAWADRFYGLDLAPAWTQAVATDHRTELPPEALLAAPATLGTYRPPSVEQPFAATLAFAIERPGRLAGVAGWFEADLAPGVTLTNAPGTGTHWGQFLFPWPAVDALAGDRLTVRVSLLDPTFAFAAELARDGSTVATFD